MNIVELNNLHRAYQRGQDVLKGVSFTIGSGEVVGLVGENGSGKTTIMRLALGALAPQKGSIRLFGLDPLKSPVEVKSRVGYVAEDQILPEFLRVKEIFRLHQRVFGSWDSDLEKRLTSNFEIPPNARVKELSKGQARQLALVCAMAHRPELLLLDEPAGGLDPAVRREFLETAIQYLNEAGSTILFSSHYMGDLERLAGRILMLHQGTVLIDDKLDQIQEGFSLALIPLSLDVDKDLLLGFESCIAVRKHGHALHAVFQLSAEETQVLLSRTFGTQEIQCQNLPLEEMFIEIVGGRH